MKKASARERILETAGDLFARNGYALVGINEIIAKSETAKASFYQHFKSKELLCAEWLRSMHERSVEKHDSILASGKSPERKTKDYFAELKKWLIGNDFRGCPYTNTTSMLSTDAPAIREQVEIHKLFIRDFFVELAQGITSGSQAQQLGSTLFLLYSGATAEAQNVRSVWPVESATQAALKLVEEASG
jgi:AcrR family transcriptional regulator